jgi:glycogen(starch) synthase
VFFRKGSQESEMKLLIYSHFFAPSIGGVETIVLSLASGLATLDRRDGGTGFDITVITQTPVSNFDDNLLPFRVIRQPGFAQLWREIRASAIVHIAGPALMPLLLGLLSRKVVVVEHHGFHTICPNGQMFIEPQAMPCPGHFMAGRHAECLRCNSSLGWPAATKLWLLTFVRRFLCSKVAANITPTNWLGAQMNLPRVQFVPHGLEITPLALRATAVSAAAPLIVFQGRLVTTKGTRLLLEAARILRSQNYSFELLIIGDGPERAKLEQLAADWLLTSHVRFAGRLAAAELEASIAQANIIVVPSLGGEVFGLVVAENMLRGLPVVASDLGAFVEVLGDTGLVFRTGDAVDLARQLAVMLQDQNLAARFSSLSRKRIIDFFGRSRMIEGHARIYRTLSEGQKNQ